LGTEPAHSNTFYLKCVAVADVNWLRLNLAGIMHSTAPPWGTQPVHTAAAAAAEVSQPVLFAVRRKQRLR
jgi:hypothetical protein